MQYFLVLNRLFDASQRRRYVLLQAYFLLAAVVQVVSVASIAPFIALVSRPALIHQQRFAQQLFTQLGFASDREFLIAFAVALMGLIAISNAVPAVMTWLTWSFAKRLGAELQADIYRGYVHGNLALLARVNSAQMIRTVIHGVNRLVYMVIQPLLVLIASAFVIVLITVALLLYDAVVALSAGAIIGGGYFAVFAVTKSRLSRHGLITWAAADTKQRLLTESLGALKEIRLAGTESLYEERLRDVTDRTMHSESMIGLLGELPRYALEAIALCALLGMGVALLIARDDWSGIVAILSLYAMAGYRLLPAAQSVFRSASTIRANMEAVSDIENELKVGRSIRLVSADDERVEYPADGAITMENVWFRYPETAAPVITGLSLAIPRRAITAIVGTSGAGKSTVADLLMGLLAPSEGHVAVGGTPITRGLRSWQRQVAFVAQSVFIVDDTITANIAFGSHEPADPVRVREAARMANVSQFVEQLPEGFNYRVGEGGSLLSGGQQQRIGIARALYNDADVIVLDEPTSALDAVTERDVMATLETLRETKTIIIISHRLTTLRRADQVVLLGEGRLLASGTFDGMLKSNERFRALVAAESHGDHQSDGSNTPAASHEVR